jgi:hypothetical protein
MNTQPVSVQHTRLAMKPTFAEHQHAYWSGIHAYWAEQADTATREDRAASHTQHAADAEAVMAAIDAYQPWDFREGNSWAALQTTWADNDHALASLCRIVRALAQYHEAPYRPRQPH